MVFNVLNRYLIGFQLFSSYFMNRFQGKAVTRRIGTLPSGAAQDPATIQRPEARPGHCIDGRVEERT
jgi:hypothetical protein